MVTWTPMTFAALATLFAVVDATTYPVEYMTCDGTPVTTTPTMDEALYDEVAANVVALYESFDSTCGSSYCPRADFAGCVVRFAGHDLMDFRIHDTATWHAGLGGTTGGSDGCILFDDADNAGLAACLATDNVSLNDAYARTCERVSFADFTVIAAEAVMAITATSPTAAATKFKQNFMWGRTTASSCNDVGLMPNPEKGCNDLHEIFVEQVYAAYQSTLDSIRSTRCDGPVCGVWDGSVSCPHSRLAHAGLARFSQSPAGPFSVMPMSPPPEAYVDGNLTHCFHRLVPCVARR